MTFIKGVFTKNFTITLVVLLAVVAGYFGYRAMTAKSASPQYLTALAEQGTLTVSVSGTGQVASANQIDLKPKTSGDVVSVSVKNGQTIKSGQVIAQLDGSDAYKAVRDAQISLESAKLTLQKLQKPADSLSLLQAQNTAAQAQEDKTGAEADLARSYDDGFNSITTTFLDLPSIMSGLQDILYSSTLSLNQQNLYFFSDAVKAYAPEVVQYQNDADASYQLARKLYDKNFADFKAANRYNGATALGDLINETYDTVKAVAEAVKDLNNFINFYQDQLAQESFKTPATVQSYVSNLQNYTSKTNSSLVSLLTVKNSIQNANTSLLNSKRNILERNASLQKLTDGTDALDIQSQQLSVRQRELALSDAQSNLGDTTIRSPIDGVVAKISIKRGDSVSSATVAATLIAEQKLATVSLNEVDVAKVKLGQKSTLSFDAIENLSMSGEVVDIETLGTASQGVVSYTVTIAFDSQDERIKPGMSASSAIITDIRADVVLVPNSAVKSQGQAGSYVEILDQGVPKQVPVQAGLSNDTSTEITSGLQAGQEVITQTITQTSATQSQTQVRGGTGGILPIGGGNATFRTQVVR